MAKVLRQVQQFSLEEMNYTFYCPACKSYHGFKTTGNEPRWTFNGDMNKPTVRPSLLMTWTYGEDNKPFRCHLFVTDGKIQYLSDCLHEFAGKTVDMQEED